MTIANAIDNLITRLRPRPKLEKWEDAIAREWELYDLLCKMRGT